MKSYMFLIFIFFISCTQGEEYSNMNKRVEILKINDAAVKSIALKKIYFGHQSVGFNIVDALKTLVPADSGLKIVETDNPEDFKKPLFAHSQNGENFKPETKIASFSAKMNSGLGNKTDAAFFKFCYVDITADTDVNKLFSEYKSSMDILISKYPETMFLHVTAPVTTEKVTGIKDKIKGVIKTMLGKHSGDVYDNIRRMEFNELLRKEYKEKVFDLAAIESSDGDGKVIMSDAGGVKHNKLISYYTTDGGHLNSEGGKIAALKLIDFIYSQKK